MIAHPDYARLLEVLRGCSLHRLDRVVYRAVSSHYAGDADLLTGAGSLKVGGRWNTRGGFRVVYASFDDHTALAESKAQFAAYGFSKPERRTIVPLRVRLERVVILEEIAAKIGMETQELLRCDWRGIQGAAHEPITQAIGRAGHELGVQALQAPSDRFPAGVNVVVFIDHAQGPEELEILAPGGRG